MFQVDKYRIYKKIGSGFSSDVFYALDQNNKEVAVKVYKVKYIDIFENEVLVYKELRHEHIVEMVDVYRDQEIVHG